MALVCDGIPRRDRKCGLRAGEEVGVVLVEEEGVVATIMATTVVVVIFNGQKGGYNKSCIS